MSRESRESQQPPSMNQSSVSASRWLVVTVAFCGALAGGSIVEVIAAFTSGTSMSAIPGHLIATPLAFAGALSGGLLTAILASRDHSHSQQADPKIAPSLAAVENIPPEPMMWQPTPRLLAITRISISTSAPHTRSKRRALRVRRGVCQSTHRHHPGRLAVPQWSHMTDTSCNR